MKNIILLSLLVALVQSSAFAIPGIPEARIACPGKFYATVLFNQDFSTYGPHLNKIVGRANVMDSSNQVYQVTGYQVVNQVKGDPVFWLFTLRKGSTNIDVKLTQQHDWDDTAYGEAVTSKGPDIPLTCQMTVQLNGVGTPKPPSDHPYPRFNLMSVHDDPCDRPHPPPAPRCR